MANNQELNCSCGRFKCTIDCERYATDLAIKVFEMTDEKKCICEYEDLEQGDTLYIEHSWDGGIEFDYIRNIKFCPVCGKELPDNG